MNKPGISWAVLFSLCLLLAVPAHAGALTDAKITGFIDSFQSMEQIAKKYDDLDDLDELTGEDHNPMAGGDFNPMSQAVEAVRGHPIYNELSETVAKHGFSSAEDWASHGDRIMRAMMALEMQERDGDMDQEMQRAMQEMENNPHITPEQRAMMKQQMEQAASGMKAMADAPAADIEAVRAHSDRLRQALMEDDTEY